MARVLSYRYFNSDITPTSLYYDLHTTVCRQPWVESIVAKWNRHLHGPVPGNSICWGCKETLRNWAVRGIVDTCAYCSPHFRDLYPGPQAMLLATAHDARLLLYTFSWQDQDYIYGILYHHMRVQPDHGILPQSYQRRVSQEDVQPACNLVLNSPHVTLMPAALRVG